MLPWLGRVALELIGQSGLGYSLDSFTSTDDKGHDFARAIKSFESVILLCQTDRIADCDRQREVMSPFVVFRTVLPFFFKIGSPSFRRRVLEMIPLTMIRRAIGIADTIGRYSRKIYESKILALQQGDEAVAKQVGEGRDIMSKLRPYRLRRHEGPLAYIHSSRFVLQSRQICPLRKKTNYPSLKFWVKWRMYTLSLTYNPATNEFIRTMLFAATDTSSAAIARILHLLAEHPDVQQKLREEIIAVMDGKDELPYDELSSLSYLDAVYRETLRLYVHHCRSRPSHL